MNAVTEWEKIMNERKKKEENKTNERKVTQKYHRRKERWKFRWLKLVDVGVEKKSYETENEYLMRCHTIYVTRWWIDRTSKDKRK